MNSLFIPSTRCLGGRVDETLNTKNLKKNFTWHTCATKHRIWGRTVKYGGWPKMSILKLESPIGGISTGAFQLSRQVSSSSTFKLAWACFHLPWMLVSTLLAHPWVPFCLHLLLSFPWTPLTLIALEGHNRLLPWHHTFSDVRTETGKRGWFREDREVENYSGKGPGPLPTTCAPAWGTSTHLTQTDRQKSPLKDKFTGQTNQK